MITVICPRCKQQYAIDEHKIPAKVKMGRCKSCGDRFPLNFVNKQGNATENAILEKPRETRVIAVSLSKGGVGKTTTAVNLAAGLALAGKEVLLVDTDTQGQASYMLGLKPKAGLTELVTGEVTAEEAIVKARERLWVLAGGRSLAGVKRFIDRKDFGGEKTLTETLTPLEKDYDYVIIDTAPGWDVLTVNVLFYAKEILVPISLEIMSVQGLSEFMKSISAIQKYHEVKLRYMVPTFHDKRIRKSTEILDKLCQLYPDYICDPIRNNIRLMEAPQTGQLIYEFAPGSPGTHDYRDLVRKVEDNDNLFR